MSRRHQHTIRNVEGCRVRLTWREQDGQWKGKGHITVTDPTGDEAHELDLAARLCGGIVAEMLGSGIWRSVELGPLFHVDDHDAVSR